MRLPHLSVERPVTVLMVIFIILLLGVVSLSRLSVDLLPELNLPVAVVITDYSGAGPEEVENLVTRPLEEVVGTVKNVKNVSSLSMSDTSLISVEFNWGTNMDRATIDLRESVDMIKGYLPDGTGEPLIFSMDPSLMPIMQGAMTGGRDLAELKDLAENTVQPRLERIPGVASVEVTGGAVREIQVRVDPKRLAHYGLSMDSVGKVLGAENISLPAGYIKEGSDEFIVRTVGEFKEVDEIGALPLTTPAGSVIKLSDVAEVSDTWAERREYARMNGEPSISISIMKESGANTAQVAGLVNREIERLSRELPGDVQLAVIFDQSDFINQSVSRVATNAALGGVLAMLVLYFFLAHFRSTMIIGTAIPISIISTFILIYFSGLTLNVMSLGGLALGIGMLVDNAIVVLENIFRYRQEGYSPIEAAKEGSAEVSNAVIASTLTTVSVFLPVVFVEGLASQLFRELALTVTFSLLASLMVALTIIPMASSRLITGLPGSRRKGPLEAFGRFVEMLEKRYRVILEWALGHRKRTVLVAGLALVLSLLLIPVIGTEFLPPTDMGQFGVDIELPPGSSIEETDRITRQVEEVLAAEPEIETVFVSVGGVSNYASGLGLGEPNLARVDANMIDMDLRKASTQEVVERVRKKLETIPGADIKVSALSPMAMGGSSQEPVQVRIMGDDMEKLEALAVEAAERVGAIEGVSHPATSAEEGRPELRIKLKRDVASTYGLTAAQVAGAVRSVISGQTVTRYRVDGEEIDVKITGSEGLAGNLRALEALPIATPTGFTVPLGTVAEVTEDRGPVTVERYNQTRFMRVTAGLDGSRSLGAVMKDIEEDLAGLDLPQNYVIEYGGEMEQMTESFGSLGMALVLAVLLVYMVMAAQFESLLHPFVIMFSVPLAVIGVILGLAVTGRALSVPGFIGVIMLAGIVVNNAIVLVDYINTLRRRGMERTDAILKAGPTRLRPILMTTLTTVLGLFPLALGLGEGSELQAPMATVVIGGLLFSTILTLVVVPVVYCIFDDLGRNYVKSKAEDVNA